MNLVVICVMIATRCGLHSGQGAPRPGLALHLGGPGFLAPELTSVRTSACSCLVACLSPGLASMMRLRGG